MRIISGISGGMTLRTPKTVLRPSTDRTRSAIFSILGTRIENARAADLFAGSGAYGIECLSRGAKSCVFVESEKQAVATIEANLAKSKLTKGATVLLNKVDSWWTRPSGPFDLIFADPPYKKLEEDRDWNPELLKSPFLQGLLASNGIFILESWAHAKEQPLPEQWECEEDRKYGAARVRFLKLKA